MSKKGFLVTYRPGVVEYSRSHIVANRVQGWTADYAFFQEGDSHPSHLVPRELVLEVEVFEEESSDEAPRGCVWVVYTNAQGTIGGREGPYLSHEQAEARGAELSRQGNAWHLER